MRRPLMVVAFVLVAASAWAQQGKGGRAAVRRDADGKVVWVDPNSSDRGAQQSAENSRSETARSTNPNAPEGMEPVYFDRVVYMESSEPPHSPSPYRWDSIGWYLYQNYYTDHGGGSGLLGGLSNTQQGTWRYWGSGTAWNPDCFLSIWFRCDYDPLGMPQEGTVITITLLRDGVEEVRDFVAPAGLQCGPYYFLGDDGSFYRTWTEFGLFDPL